MSVDNEASAVFQAQLQNEMKLFRQQLALRICLRRKYRIKLSECLKLVSQYPDDLHQVLRAAQALNDERSGFLAGLKQWFGPSEDRWIKKSDGGR